MLATLSRLAVATALCLPLAGLDLLDDGVPFVDMRLGYGTAPMPSKFNYEFDAYAGGPPIYVTDWTSEKSATSYTLGMMAGSKSMFGLAGGIEGKVNHGRMDLERRTINGAPVGLADPPSLQYRSVGLDVMGGFEASFGSRVHLELVGFMGGGRLHIDALNGGQDAVNQVNAWYTEVGGRAGAYILLRRAVLGIAVDCTASRFTSGYTGWNDGTTYYEHNRWSGWGGRVELGYRLQ